MSGSAYVLVTQHSRARGLDYLVMLMVTDFVNGEDDRAACFDVEDIARVTRLTPAQVERVLVRLERQGELQSAPGTFRGKPFWAITCGLIPRGKGGRS